MIQICKKCARARNQVNGLYCYSLRRYVEHDDGKRPPCTVKLVWRYSDGTREECWLDDYEPIQPNK